MRHLLYLCIIAALLLAACASPSERRLMTALLSEADSMNRNYVPFTTDSVMLSVTKFFDRHGTDSDRIRAHYLLGCAYRDLGEAPQALAAFQDAIDCADTTNHEHLRILMKIYGQMAELYDLQNLPQDEIEVADKYAQCALQLKDTLLYIRNLELMLKPYYLVGDTCHVIEVVNEARQLYLEHGYPDKAAAACSSLIDLYTNQGHLHEAQQLMDEFEHKSSLFDKTGSIEKGREIYYYIKGSFYLHKNQLDSAEFNFRRLQRESRTLNDTLGFYKGLMDLYQQCRDIDSTIYYSRLYTAAFDRQSNERQTEAIHRMTKLYSYSRFQLQADREARKASRTKLIAALFALCIVVLLFLLYYLYQRYQLFKVNKLAEVDRLNRTCRQAEDALTIAELELKNEQSEKKKQLTEKAQQINELRNQLEKYIERYMAVKPSDRETLMLRSDVVNLFQEKTHWNRNTQIPNLVQWRELLAQFKLNLPTLYSAIGQGEKLSVQELRACILLLLNFTESDACILLNIRPQRLTNIKSRANQKLFGDSSAQTLISNIRYRAATL